MTFNLVYNELIKSFDLKQKIMFAKIKFNIIFKL